MIWPIPVDDFANTDEGTFSKIWAGRRFEVEIENSRVLKICVDMGVRIKKNPFCSRSVPLNVSYK